MELCQWDIIICHKICRGITFAPLCPYRDLPIAPLRCGAVPRYSQARILLFYSNPKKYNIMRNTNKKSRVVVTKVTPQERAEIARAASDCGITMSEFVRARCLGYRPASRLSHFEKQQLSHLEACRTDMVHFANAIAALSREEKMQLFHQQPYMLQWYLNVARITNAVTEYIQHVQQRNIYPAKIRLTDNTSLK